ncbi:MAG: hypothetical protein OXR66_00350 [Candidatus Woesearchaeota archaeon]|nr:hypothetical protein [Candidatus Woesearchaeota archaeon]
MIPNTRKALQDKAYCTRLVEYYKNKKLLSKLVNGTTLKGFWEVFR